MTEFKREKLSFFRKLLIKFGKKWMWWRAPKANALVLNGSFLFLNDMLIQLTNDIEKTNDEMYLIGVKAGRALFEEMLSLIEILISKSIEDLKYIIKVAWKVFLGLDPLTVTYFPPNNKNFAKITWTWNNCVMCTDAQNQLNPEHIPHLHLGAIATGIFEVALQMIEDHVGNMIKVTVLDSQSQAKGDPTCELTATFAPNPNL